MESLKSNLLPVMAYVNFDAAQGRGDSADTCQEIIDLKGQIKIHLQTINILQHREVRRGLDQSGRPSGGPPLEPLSFDHDIQVKLRFLGTRIVGQGTLPLSTDYNIYSSKISGKEDLLTAYGQSVSDESLSHSPNRSWDNKPKIREPCKPAATSRTVPAIATIMESRTQSPESWQERRRLPAWQEQESSSSSGSSIIISSSSNQVELFDSEETSSVSTRETDSISLHPSIYHLQATKLSQSLKALDGYINTAKGWKPATTWLDPNLSQNLVSLACANQLGLRVQPPDEEELPFWIRVGDGEEKKSPGSVVLQWSGDFNDSISRVRCLVYGHDEIKKTVFGAPSLERRKHYRDREM